MKKVLFVRPLIHLNVENYVKKFEMKEVQNGTQMEAMELAQQVNAFEPDAIFFIGLKTHKIIEKTFFDNLSAKAIEKLRIITNHGAGYDCIDIEEATKHKIYISNTPDVVAPATADLTIWLIISVLRRTYEYETDFRVGKWRSSPEMFGFDLQDKVVGLVGMGSIGKEVCKRLLPFGVKVIYFRRTPLSNQEINQCPFLKDAQSMSSLDELLAKSNIISLHCPLNDDTFHMISHQQFNKMKPKSYIVNTARGPIIDQDALIQNLKSGHLAGAGLDVFDKEPSYPQELLSLPNVCAVPHIGTQTKETRKSMEKLCMDNIEHVIIENASKPLTPVPEQKDLIF